MGLLVYLRRVRPATAFPFTVGVFTGTLITAFLCLALSSIEEEQVTAIAGAVATRGRGEGSVQKLPSEDVRRIMAPADVLSPRKLISYNVLTSRNEIETKVLAGYQTWASTLAGNIDFFVFPPATEKDINFAYKRRIPITSLGGSEDSEDTAPLAHYSIFRTWKEICEKKSDHYQWFMALKDHVYLRTHKLERILLALNSSEPLYLGHPVFPVGRDKDELGLRDGENYCSEAGYVVSLGTLRAVCPMLESCRTDSRSENGEVEFAKCIRVYAKTNCTTSAEVKSLFYEAEGLVAEEELQTGEHYLNPLLSKAVMLSPLTHADHFYHLHHHFSKEEFNLTKISTTKLRAHLIQTAELALQSTSRLHTSDHQSPTWTRLGINPPYLPSDDEEDIIHFQSFDAHYRYTESKHYPSHPISPALQSDMDTVLETIMQAFHEPSGKDSNVTVSSVLQRFDPQRGVDYFMQVVTENAQEEGRQETRFLHSLKEAEPPRVTSLGSANYKSTKVNFVVPAPPVSRAFQRFMMSFENGFLARTPPELVGLLVILYSDGKFRNYGKDLFATITLLDLYKKKYPQADLRLISTRKPYSRKECVELTSKEYPSYELLFLADIHTDFSTQFLERCRMNALENKQIYFPAVFNPYDPSDFYSDRIHYPYATKFQIKSQKGSWMHESFHLACVYNYDLINALNLELQRQGGNESEWNLLNLFIKFRKLEIFRSTEPGLVHLWQDGCTEEELDTRGRELCKML